MLFYVAIACVGIMFSCPRLSSPVLSSPLVGGGMAPRGTHSRGSHEEVARGGGGAQVLAVVVHSHADAVHAARGRLHACAGEQR